MTWIFYLLAIAAGAMNPAQAGANAELRKTSSAALFSAVIVYLSGLLGVLLIQLFVRESWPGAEKLGRVPWWAWTGGLLSIAATMAGISFAQKMGSGVFTGLSLTAAMITSILLDNFGLIGFKVHPASLPRIGGCLLMIIGLWMVARF